MFVVALTGGIGSGKTAASDAFAELGVPVIDTDIIARELVRPGQAALAQIVATFGQQCLSADGRLDRSQLRRLVFADEDKRKQLEKLLHPRIRQTVQQRLARIEAPYALVVIPLLVETGGHNLDYIERVLVVDTSEQTQIDRVMARDDVDREQAENILKAQASREQRLQVADDIIDNNGTLATLKLQVKRLHEVYCRLAADRIGNRLK